MISTRDTTPFMLYGAAPALTLAAGVPSNGAQSFNAADLTNPFEVPIEVSEIVFMLAQSGDVSAVATSLDLQLRAGRRDLTNGFVPLVCVGPLLDAIVIPTSTTFVGPVGSSNYTRRWILPRPLVLGPGAALAGAVRYSPLVLASNAYNQTLTVSMLLRAKKFSPGTPMPVAGPIPFVSGAFLPTNYQPSANDLSWMNTTNAVLNVTAINANLAALASGTFVQGMPQLKIVGPGGILGMPRRTILDASATSGALAFVQRQSIEVAHELLPRESYTISPYGASVGNVPAVAISGYREEAY